MDLTDYIEEREGWWWPKLDRDGWNYTRQHDYVPEKLTEYCDKRDVVVQAGGSAGYYISKYAELFKMVYVFEPDPLNFVCMTVNCPQQNVIKMQACIGNDHEFRALQTYSHDTSAGHVAGQGYLPTLRIDDLDLFACDLIQLDTEGFEYHGLLGAEKTIEKFRPVVSVEWWPEWGARYGITLDMIEDFLKKYDYELIAEHATDRVYKSK